MERRIQMPLIIEIDIKIDPHILVHVIHIYKIMFPGIAVIPCFEITGLPASICPCTEIM